MCFIVKIAAMILLMTIVEIVDSIAFEKIAEPITQIRDNTEPLYFIGGNLEWFSFAIAAIALIVGIIAALYSFKCYKYQKLSVDKLEKLVPGQMSFYHMATGLVDTINNIEAVFFGKESFRNYATDLIFTGSVLPDDLIDLQKYEKNKKCYDIAVFLKMEWRKYNAFYNNLVKLSIHCDDPDEVLSFAGCMIDYSKTQIAIIQKAENILIEEHFLDTPSASKEQLASFCMEQFFEHIQIINTLKIDDLDTSRTNLTIDSYKQYTDSKFFAKNVDFEKFLNQTHHTRLTVIDENDPSYTSTDLNMVYKQIKKGEYDFVNRYYKSILISDMDPSNFKPTYYNYMEPIILGVIRREFSKIKTSWS